MYEMIDKGRHQWFKVMSCFFMLFMSTNSHALVNAFDKAVDHPPIPFLDEQGVNVLESTNPYSPKKTCEGSGCHDYEAITHAYHFEMGRDEASDDYGKKRGLPQLVSPGYYGGYNCMGGDTPTIMAKKNNAGINDFADYGAAKMVKSCMTCHIGGGLAEKDRDGIRYDEKKIADIKPGDGDYYERHVMDDGTEHLMLWDWKKSGVGEADCLFCHVDFTKMDLPTRERGGVKSYRARDTRREFNRIDSFRGAATGFLAYVLDNKGQNLVAPVRNDDKRKTLFQDENDQPVFNWNKEAFDENGRTVIPMLRFPANENCMACHVTSNSRRGFYGFGESAAATLAGTENEADSVLEDDYQDDVHYGTVYTENNGQKRVIDNCNVCHSKQYFKSNLAAIDLDANHDFPKGNSDMDVRNDLDYAPNAKSCEECHINSNNPIIPSGHDTLLNAHRELWKSNGDMKGYSRDTLTQITKTHFDVVSCQACHINGKEARGNPLQIMFRYRLAEDGLFKMIPYNPKVRSYWQDKNSGRVITDGEHKLIRKLVKDKDDPEKGYEAIINVMTGEELGRLKAEMRGGHGGSRLRGVGAETYEDFMLIKSAYDHLLRKKGVVNPDTAEVLTESNEYVISHNTRPSPDSVQCEECHERKQSGAFSALLSTKGVMGRANEKIMRTIPDAKLVKDGHYILDLPYMEIKGNGDIVQNVEDILFETGVDPFMTLLKNSSATEAIGRFQRIPTDELLSLAGSSLAGLMTPDLPSQDSFIFLPNKGKASIRNLAAAIDGNTINSILFPTYRAALGLLEGIDSNVQGFLDERGFGKLRSNVFYIDILDAGNNPVTSFNGAPLFVKALYKGHKTATNEINVVVANKGTGNSNIRTIPASDILEMQHATDEGDGYVVFKTSAPGYFIVSDK